MSRIMGLDFGSHTVGVAMTDELCMMAHEKCTITRERENKLRQTLAKIAALCEENHVERIVLGLPVNMDGTESERSEKTRLFAESLKQRTHIPVELYDERLTSVEAREILDESGVPRSGQKRYIDQIAAAIILQDYLNNRRSEGQVL